MLRTFNYTGRHKILQTEADFELNHEPGNPPEFNVTLRLDNRDMPGDAKVYVEAGYKETRQRFDFGTLSRIAPPANRVLNEIDLSGTTLFRIIIVDESSKHGLILASGEGFRYESDDQSNKSSLLAVSTHPLEELCWKIDYEDPDKPELIINKRIPNALEKMRSDSLFQALILPAAFHQILWRYLFSDDFDMDSESFGRWLSFTTTFLDGDPRDMDDIEKEKWLDDVIKEFSKKFEFASRLIDIYKDEE